ncbi:hypothetical protein ARMGADRAFT_1111772 [Armillaria gallica]|uniref:DUF6589 domain-containing protein n=1 Tax=Armillaria gallica TaxID=47427 RepID=A0A2H3D556_ARMGA|nr:hypothetical protein ARMGADRAFT_1111772 [Armillaria gallica]
MYPIGLRLVLDRISDEMDNAKEHFSMTTTLVTPEFLSSWNIQDALSSSNMNRLFPTWSKILDAATQSKRAEKNQVRTPELATQVLHLRSANCAKFQSIVGLFAWASSCSRQAIEFLSRCSLSTSFTGAYNTIKALANRCVAIACYIVLTRPTALALDNINLKTSLFVEQTGSDSTPHKVQSGTFAVIYELYGVTNPNHMLLSPILSRLQASQPFSMADFRPSTTQRRIYLSQTSVNIIRTLLTYSPAFSSYTHSAAICNIARRPLPADLITVFHPLRVSTIEEASVEGNLRVHDDIYMTQLQRRPEDMNTYAIPLIADQLTNKFFQIGIGLFHLQMNLAWCLLNKHHHSEDQIGSLAYFFTIMNKKRLNGEKPDYHTLTTALLQIRHGLLLNAWFAKCGKADLDKFARSNPTPQQLHSIAMDILLDLATPLDPCMDSDEADPSILNPADDPIHQNTRMLLRDLLYFEEVANAISSGDFGRIEDILPDIACIFRGGGSNNYSTEILHLLYNLKVVWTPEFA